MTDDPGLDLSPLDAEADPQRLERCARAVAVRVAPSLRRRRERGPGLWLQLARWQRPVLAAAVLVAVGSAALLMLPRPEGASRAGQGTSASPTLAEAEGLPAPLAAWVENGTPPPGDLSLGVQETR